MRGFVTVLLLAGALAACAAPRAPDPAAPQPAPEPVCPREGAPLSCAGAEDMATPRAS